MGEKRVEWDRGEGWSTKGGQVFLFIISLEIIEYFFLY